MDVEVSQYRLQHHNSANSGTETVELQIGEYINRIRVLSQSTTLDTLKAVDYGCGTWIGKWNHDTPVQLASLPRLPTSCLLLP